MKAVEGSVVLGGDPVVTLEGAVPLPKLYSFSPLTLPPLPPPCTSCIAPSGDSTLHQLVKPPSGYIAV